MVGANFDFENGKLKDFRYKTINGDARPLSSKCYASLWDTSLWDGVARESCSTITTGCKTAVSQVALSNCPTISTKP